MWYVVQVVGGREESALRLIRKHVDESLFDEVFVPRYRASRKIDGDWRAYEELLTPGYIIVVTKRVETLAVQLRTVPAFTRLLGGDDGFIPLNREERAWLEAWTQRESRVLEASTGRIEKGRLKVLSGPLFGREGDIVKVNRRKRYAIIRMNVMGRTKDVKVGLEIVGKDATVA